MERDTIAFAVLLSLSCILTLLAVISVNMVIIALAVSATIIAVVFYRMWYFIEDALFKHTGMIEMVGQYELSGSREAAIRSTNDGLIAATAAVLEINNADAVESRKIENIISRVGYPFKFTLQARRQDVNGLVDRIKTRISLKEIQLSRLGTSQKELHRSAQARREVEVLQNDLRNIQLGDAPLRLIYYISTSAVSESRYDAEERAKSQLRELSGQFDALLGSNSRALVGSELLEVLMIDGNAAI